MMKIALGSKRGPKYEALENTLNRIRLLLNPDDPRTEIEAFEIDTGISMPRSLEELMNGARRRVEMLQQRTRAEYYVGLEGGFHTITTENRRCVFLQGWAYVSDGKVGYYGSSGNIEVPDRIAHEVMEKKRDLGAVIDEVAFQHDVRSKQGTWGVLTHDLIRRSQSFETALLTAFAPFYNSKFYR
ncbi:MAG: inosine/xanthosine triphosphatase [Pseudomonadota bacterium]